MFRRRQQNSGRFMNLHYIFTNTTSFYGVFQFFFINTKLQIASLTFQTVFDLRHVCKFAQSIDLIIFNLFAFGTFQR